MSNVWIGDSKLSVCEKDRQAVLDYQCKDNKMIDIFENVIEGLSTYLVCAKKVKKELKDMRFSMTEYTPKGTIEKECCIRAKKIEEVRREFRKEFFEDFIDNKYFDAQLVDKMLSFDNEFCRMNLHLSLSDICDENFYNGRLAYVYNQLVIELEAEEIEAKKVVDYQLQLVEKIVNYAKAGYTLRFWCSYNNEDLCSLYYLMNLLRDIECSILLLNLPQRIHKSNGRFMNKLRKWSQIPWEQIGFAISQSNPHFITVEEKQKYAQIWDNLKEENAKIRITDGNEIKSVPIDYYFDLIERNCPKDKPFKLTKLLDLIYKNEKNRNLDLFPYYFWSTQFAIMMDRGILRKVKDVTNGCWSYNCWVEYVGEPPKTELGISSKRY